MEHSTLPWVEKYRPDTLEGVVSHDDIINTLTNIISNKKIPHMIFYGPPGTGKTTTILACAKQIYGEDYRNMILELNGSDERGINVVREQIKEFSSSNYMMGQLLGINYKNETTNMKLVILDEADSMTYDAQFALRRVIENHISNTRFCLICNYLTKIIPALQSRCSIFKFKPINLERHLNHIQNIANKENVNITTECLNHIVDLAEGDMRKSINILQSLYLAYPNKIIDISLLYQIIGYPHPIEYNTIMKNILIETNIKDAYNTILKFKNQKNLSVNDILKELTAFIINSNIPNIKLANILDKLAKIEVHLTGNVNQDVQLAAIISTILS